MRVYIVMNNKIKKQNPVNRRMFFVLLSTRPQFWSTHLRFFSLISFSSCIPSPSIFFFSLSKYVTVGTVCIVDIPRRLYREEFFLFFSIFFRLVTDSTNVRLALRMRLSMTQIFQKFRFFFSPSTEEGEGEERRGVFLSRARGIIAHGLVCRRRT